MAPSLTLPEARAEELEVQARRAVPGVRTAERVGTALLVALVLACLYAAFASGAVLDPGAARLQVAIAAVAALTAAAWVPLGDLLEARTSRAGRLGLAGLVLFGVWSVVSLAWSHAPSATWLAGNRAIAYALVAGLALIAGARAPRAIERAATWLLVVPVLAAVYALLTLVLPGLSLGGLLDLDRASVVPRLTAPVGTWEGLGLLCALGFPLALRLVTDGAVRERGRLGALAAGWALACVVGIADARVAMLAGGAAIAVAVLVGSVPVRSLLVALAQLLLALPVVLVARALDVGTGPLRPVADREDDGLLLLAVLAACLVALLALGLFVGRGLLARPEREGTAFPALLAGALVALVVAGAAVGIATGALIDVDQGGAIAQRGLAPSAERTTWWEEALGVASSEPVGGAGAGSFALQHLQRRTTPVQVDDPHSLPLGLLAETGVVGLIAWLGGLLALGWAATRRVLLAPAGRERDLGAGLLAVGVAWLVHSLFEPDLALPAVTLPMLVALGVLAARPSLLHLTSVPPRRAILVDARAETRGTGLRGLAAVLATLALAAVAASAVLPSVAADRVASARERAAGGSAGDLQLGAGDAQLAAKLDPLSPDPLLALAVVDERRGRLVDARNDLLEAAKREPESPDAWGRLTGVLLQLRDYDGAVAASRRAAALDPANPLVAALARSAQSARVLPEASATATGTPLGDADAVRTIPGG